MPEPENPEKTPEMRLQPATIDAVRDLVQMMKENELTALDFSDGSTKIRLRRHSPEAIAAGGAYPALGGFGPPGLVYQPGNYPPGPTSATTLPQQPISSTSPASPPLAPAGTVIESPMVGTFYSSSSPEAPSFVSVGSTVRPDATVCIIEAMKVFTDIPAGVSGTITEVLVKSGQPVEYGQPLFRVNPA